MYGIIVFLCLGTGNAVLYFILVAMTGMLLLSLLSLLLVRLRFMLDQKITPMETTAGAGGTLSIILSNPYLFPFPQLEAEYLLPGPGEGFLYGAAFSVLPLQRVVIEEKMALPCRGVYTVGLKTILVYDVFGLFRLRMPYEKIAKKPRPRLTVLPRMIPPAQAPLPVMESPVNFSGAARATEDTSSPADSRAYRPGDPLKRIHWKLSARQGQLIVKTYEPAAVSDALIYLDTESLNLDPTQAWYADDVMTAAALSLTARILAEDVPVQLIYVKDRRSVRRMTSMEETASLARELAGLDIRQGQNLRTLLSGETGPLGNARYAFVLTRKLGEEGVDLFITLHRAGIKLRLCLCRGNEEPLDDEESRLIQLLAHQQIPLCVLTPRAGLDQCLEALQ